MDPGIRAAAADDRNTILILNAIGFDPWSGKCVTAKRISAELRNMGGTDVTVNMNSPGGDMFEGLAIYNWTCPYKIGLQLPVKLMLPPSA